MTKSEFKASQKIPQLYNYPQYMMYILDVKNSAEVLKTRSGRREFQSLLNETRSILDKHPGIIEFKNDGIPFKLIRKGDCIGFVLDTTVPDNSGFIDSRDGLISEWTPIIKETNLRFHKNSCSLPNLENYMDFFEYLEKDSKEPSIENKTSPEGNKILKITIDLEVEDFIEEDYVKTEIEHTLKNYAWEPKSIKIKGEK